MRHNGPMLTSVANETEFPKLFALKKLTNDVCGRACANTGYVCMKQRHVITSSHASRCDFRP